MIDIKKLIFMSLCLVLTLSNTKAFVYDDYVIEATKGGETTVIELSKKQNSQNNLLYLVSPFDDYTVSRDIIMDINNIALVEGTQTTLEYQIGGQIAIWNLVHPDYTFAAINKYTNQPLDVSIELIQIQIDIERYHKKPSFAGNTYTVNYNDTLILHNEEFNVKGYTLKEKLANEGYNSNDIYISSIKNPGYYELEFINDLIINDNYLEPVTINYEPFSIYLDVLCNYIYFNNTEMLEDESLTFFLENIDKEWETKEFTISSTNNFVAYFKDANVILKDISNSKVFELLDDIKVLNNEEGINMIDLNLIYKTYNITFKSDFDILVYDKNLDLVGTYTGCKNDTITLNAGKYFFFDNETNRFTYHEIYENKEINMHPLISVIKSNKEIISISDTETNIPFKKINNLYFLDDSYPLNIYDFTFQNTTKRIDLFDTSKLSYLEKIGYCYDIDEPLIETKVVEKPVYIYIEKEVVSETPVVDETNVDDTIPDDTTPDDTIDTSKKEPITDNEIIDEDISNEPNENLPDTSTNNEENIITINIPDTGNIIITLKAPYVKKEYYIINNNSIEYLD